MGAFGLMAVGDVGSGLTGVGNGSHAGGLGEVAAFASRGEPLGATGPPHLSNTRGFIG